MINIYLFRLLKLVFTKQTEFEKLIIISLIYLFMNNDLQIVIDLINVPS